MSITIFTMLIRSLPAVSFNSVWQPNLAPLPRGARCALRAVSRYYTYHRRRSAKRDTVVNTAARRVSTSSFTDVTTIYRYSYFHSISIHEQFERQHILPHSITPPQLRLSSHTPCKHPSSFPKASHKAKTVTKRSYHSCGYCQQKLWISLSDEQELPGTVRGASTIDKTFVKRKEGGEGE